jgi:hypothetical protein
MKTIAINRKDWRFRLVLQIALVVCLISTLLMIRVIF